MALSLCWRTYVYPLKNDSKRSYCKANWVFPPDDYLARNKSIVKAADVMCIVPGEFKQVVRSGTWATYRYSVIKAAESLEPFVIYVIYPDGTYDYTNNEDRSKL